MVGSTISNWNTLTGKQKEQMILEAILNNITYEVTDQNGDEIEA